MTPFAPKKRTEKYAKKAKTSIFPQKNSIFGAKVIKLLKNRKKYFSIIY
jgi:hypothetical protein